MKINDVTYKPRSNFAFITLNLEKLKYIHFNKVRVIGKLCKTIQRLRNLEI